MRIHGHAHLLQHICETLRGEERLLPVAGPFQPHYDAVTYQLVVADAFERHQFLQTRGRRLGQAGTREQRQAKQ